MACCGVGCKCGCHECGVATCLDCLGRVDKRDTSKPPMILLACLRAPLGMLAEVLEFGNKKYRTIYNYRTIDDGANRMASASARHLLAHGDGEYLDPESGLPHLAHAACDALMALWFCMQEKTNASTTRVDEVRGR